MVISVRTVTFGAALIAGLVILGLGYPAPGTAAAPNGGTLQSLSVELPTGDREFPPGPHVDVISANCVACHSAGMILNQPNLTKATWEAEVNKMIKIYKAPVDAADVPAIVDYLAAVKGK
jgi:sulfite dehydrogenase (cytochrome) subunit B